MTTLVSFLGKGQDGRGYRNANYQFDDGEIIETFQNETVYSHMFWQIFKPYPKARILKSHHIRTILGKESLTTDTHTKLCSKIFRSIVEDENLFLPEEKEPLLALIYKTISSSMSRLSILSEEIVTSIDILDFIEIAKHPEIERLRT